MLEKKLKHKLSLEFKPVFFDAEKKSEQKKLSSLLKNHSEIKINDGYIEQLEELFFTLNPNLIQNLTVANTKFKNFLNKQIAIRPLYQQGLWVYFPWLNTLNHILDEANFFRVRTSRNQMLITPKEQKKFYSTKVGIGGLSIGSSVAIALVLQGGTKFLKLADFDKLALSNTNRVRAGIQDLGLSKIQILCRQIYEINPYAIIEIFPTGLNKQNIKKFISGLDIIVDEMDNLAVKLLLRIEAKKHKIPVLMGADNGNSAVIDIERYDRLPNLKFFHNRLGKITFQKLSKLKKQEIGQTIAKLIGKKNHEARMLNSLQEIGKTVVSWPQLGGTAMLNASAISYVVRNITNGLLSHKNRVVISFNSLFKNSNN